MNPRIRCSISPLARMLLSKRGDGEYRIFESQRIESEHPAVDEHVLDAIYDVEKLCHKPIWLQVYWELQPDFVHRWHVMAHRAQSKEDSPLAFHLVQDGYVSMIESAPYLPLDWRVVRHLREIWPHQNDQNAFVKEFQRKQWVKRMEKRMLRMNQMHERAKELRRGTSRLFRHNASDPGWSPGISFNEQEKVYETSAGPLGRQITSVFPKGRVEVDE